MKVSKIFGMVSNENGSITCVSDKDFIIWGGVYMMKRFGISLHGMENAYNSGILFYGKGGWQLKTKPKDNKNPHYWSQFSDKWKIDQRWIDEVAELA